MLLELDRDQDADSYLPAPSNTRKLTKTEKDQVRAGTLKPDPQNPKSPLNQAIVKFLADSAGSKLGWKRREELGIKKHKKNKKWHEKQEQTPWQEKQQLQKGNDPGNRYTQLLEYVAYLEGITDRFYLRRINDSELADREKEPFLQCFPNRSSRIQWTGRIVHSWSHLPAKHRNKIFRGDYDLDIRKCHLTIFLSLLRRHAPELTEVQRFDIQSAIDEFTKLGFKADCAKELLNATVHGGGKRAYQKTKREFGNSGLENPPILETLKGWRKYLLANHSVTTPFGEAISFRNPDEKGSYEFNRKRWERCLYLWENFLKIRLFHDLDSNRCHIVYDSYDGCIIKVKDKRLTNLIDQEIRSRCQRISQEMGVKVDFKMKEIV